MSNIDKIIEQLNDRQREAVQITEGPLLVVAGAGSGKTKTLTVRIAYLIEHCHVNPRSILAVTFTNKAAKEMRERVRNIVFEGDKVNLTTFHSFCCQVLRRWPKAAGFNDTFTIYDEADSEKLMKNTLKELNIDTKAYSPRNVLEKISQAKNELIGPEDYLDHYGESSLTKELQRIYAAYQDALMKNQAVDFDDLIFTTYKTLKDNSALLDKLQRQYQYFLVDEYQDTNHAQYCLISMLSSASRNLCVVGDEDQSIYSWRGATIRNIQDFDKDFPGAQIVKLEQNYRSTQVILDAAGAVISNNSSTHKKRLWTDKEGGDKLVLHKSIDDREEADWFVRKVKELHDEGNEYSDIAVLFRMNSLSRPFEQALQRMNIPYDITGGIKFFDRREVKDILAYLRVLDNPSDSISLERIINTPKRGIGQGAIDKLYGMGQPTLWEAVALEANRLPNGKIAKFYAVMTEIMEMVGTMSVSLLTKSIIETIKYFEYLQEDDPETATDRKNNVEALVSDIRYQEEDNSELTLRAYLENVSLHSSADDLNEKSNKVHLMTLHNAKGLEFPIVFMVAMEEEVFPHHSSQNSTEELEEERRLAYVGITRAREKLFMSCSGRRMVFGRWNTNLVSRFITEVPQELFETRTYSVTNGSGRFNGNSARITFGSTGALRGAISSKPVSNTGYSMNAGARWSKEKKSDVQSSGENGNMVNLKPGVRVMHPTFGYGVVEEVSGNSLPEFKVSIKFENKGVKSLLLQYTTLRVIKD